MNRRKLFRISTVSISLKGLFCGQLSFLSDYYDITGIASGKDILECVGKQEGINTIHVSMERRISIFKDIRSLLKMYRVFRIERPDIIHSITPKAGLISMVAGKLAGVQVRMHTFTGLIFPTETGLKQRVLIAMDRLLCICATNIYPEGEGVRKDLIKYRITKKELKIIGNGNIKGIDTAYFDPDNFSNANLSDLRNEFHIEDNNFVFIFVGRLVRDKGINELVSAFRRLNEEEPLTKLLLVGPYEDDIDPLFPETYLEIDNNDSIIAVGGQNDVRPFYAISDVLVFPSYREGMPNVVIEAGAMNLPSIVTDINGSNEIILNGVNGLIIKPQNSEELYCSMKKLLIEKSLRDKMRSVSREMVISRYSQSIVWNALLDEYRKLERQKLGHDEKK